MLLFVVMLTLVAGAFHELGHATASRYSGAEPGTIGAGISLIWPVFYNDLQDSHRLGRGGRRRCDLGGVYCNVVFILALDGSERPLDYARGDPRSMSVILAGHGGPAGVRRPEER